MLFLKIFLFLTTMLQLTAHPPAQAGALFTPHQIYFLILFISFLLIKLSVFFPTDLKTTQ